MPALLNSSGKPARGQAVLSTIEMNLTSEPPAVQIGGQVVQSLFQISPSWKDFTDLNSAIWAHQIGDRADGLLRLYPAENRPFIFQVGVVELPKEGEGTTTVEIPMRADAPLWLITPTPGMVVGYVPPPSWMHIHDGNLEAFRTWMIQHWDPMFVNPGGPPRARAIGKAQQDFYESTLKESGETEPESESTSTD